MKWFQKLTKIKGIGFIFLAFAAGVVLLLLPSEREVEVSEGVSSSEYAQSLQNQLEEILESATGSTCTVMITFEGGYSYSYAANETLNTVYNGAAVASKNVTKEYVIASKDGDEQLILIRENLPEVKGVAVVCNGGETERHAVISIVKSLFQLPDEAVCCELKIES